jgi:predicted ATPase
MKIKRIQIQNFRSFQDETITLNRYSCFVGPNGCGKSTVLCALNIFFREQASSATDVVELESEDYFAEKTSEPIRITVTFDELGERAKSDLAAYFRNGELVVTAEAIFDEGTRRGTVRHYGHRLGMEDFRCFFEAEKASAKAAELTGIYDRLKQEHPTLPAARSKDDKAQALRDYESANVEKCVLIASEDNFYGVNSTGKLAVFVQWVYVPAVKDAVEEGLEAKNTALGKLVARAVRNKTSFDKEIEELESEALTKYRGILERNKAGLDELSASLQRRLESWAHPGVHFGMEWISDPNKSVAVQQPVAGIKAGEGDFVGKLVRMGHGLQRSYLLALLQELAASDAPDAPTLILGCEEPELYQHPPQARHLAGVFAELANANNQILITTHSPLFVSGDGFEDVRLVSRANPNAGTCVRSVEFGALCARIREAMGEDPTRKIEGLVAKIHQALQPALSEMFFAKVPVLVEGLEDVAYIMSQLHLMGAWPEFRRLGCHLIPAGGKDKLIQPLALAVELKMPVFVVFDADGDTKREDHRIKHERDNRALLKLLGIAGDAFPQANLLGSNHAVWATSLTKAVRGDFPNKDLCQFLNSSRQHYAHEGGLEKHELFIADWLAAASQAGYASQTLNELVKAIFGFAQGL